MNFFLCYTEDTIFRHSKCTVTYILIGGRQPIVCILKKSYCKLAFFMIVWPCIVTNSLWIKPTDALNSNFICITTLHVSGSLSAHHQEFLAIHRLWYILCSCDDRLLPGVVSLQKRCRENQTTHFMFINFFFLRKSCRLWDNVEKYCRGRQATDDNMSHAHCTLIT